MLAGQGVGDDGISQANSLTAPCLRHFISCEETGTITQLTDIKKAAVVLDSTNPANTGDIIMAEGDDPGVTVSLKSWHGGSNVETEFTWDAPLDKDFLIMAIGRAKIDPTKPVLDPNPYYGGAISFYFSSNDGANQPELKIHPYFTAFTPAGGDQFSTPYYAPMMRRNADQVYAVCGVKRGDYIEHWVDGVKRGELEVASRLEQQDAFNAAGGLGGTTGLSSFRNFTTGSSSFFTGHAAYDAIPPVVYNQGIQQAGTADESPAEIWAKSDANPFDREQPYGEGPYFWAGTPLYDWFNVDGWYAYLDRADGGKDVQLGSWVPSNVLEEPNDMHGFIVCIFENGMPDDVGAAMDWMKEQWVLGNKSFYPGWVTLL
jgi:hypothetical protein